MGPKTFAIDEKPPRANLVKLSGNFPITSILDSLGETFALTRKSGIDPHQFLEILTGTLFRHAWRPYLRRASRACRLRDDPGLIGICLALAAAESLLVPMPLASQIRDRMLTVVARGEPLTGYRRAMPGLRS